jgi:hypothetical protein
LDPKRRLGTGDRTIASRHKESLGCGREQINRSRTVAASERFRCQREPASKPLTSMVCCNHQGSQEYQIAEGLQGHSSNDTLLISTYQKMIQ